MNSKEGPGFVDKGLETWQKWNKLTLTLEGAAILAGVGLGIPALINLGAVGAVIDAAQYIGINTLQKWRKGSGKPSNHGFYKTA